MDFIPILSQPISKREAELKNSLVLAFVGDSVQTLYVRSRLALTDGHKSGELHYKAISEVSAKAQAAKVEELCSLFTPEEEGIFRRAKNSKPHSVAKNALPSEYHLASGYEAVLGYLYLTGQSERLQILLQPVLPTDNVNK